MKKSNLLVFGALALALSFTACKTENKEKQDSQTTTEQTTASQEFTGQDGHTTQNSVDWDGTYQGVIPCADCPGIKVTIVLNPDGTFQREDVYMDKKDGTINETGSFTWDKTGTIVTLKGKDQISQFKVQEGNIVMLDTDGNIIEGPLAQNYVLKKLP
ncbi:copper resistance protein NlpE [Myroides sp. LJL116]